MKVVKESFYDTTDSDNFDCSASDLAYRMDRFAYNADPYGYADALDDVSDTERNVQTIETDIANGTVDSYIYYLEGWDGEDLEPDLEAERLALLDLFTECNSVITEKATVVKESADVNSGNYEAIVHDASVRLYDLLMEFDAYATVDMQTTVDSIEEEFLSTSYFTEEIDFLESIKDESHLSSDIHRKRVELINIFTKLQEYSDSKVNRELPEASKRIKESASSKQPRESIKRVVKEATHDRYIFSHARTAKKALNESIIPKKATGKVVKESTKTTKRSVWAFLESYGLKTGKFSKTDLYNFCKKATVEEKKQIRESAIQVHSKKLTEGAEVVNLAKLVKSVAKRIQK